VINKLIKFIGIKGSISSVVNYMYDLEYLRDQSRSYKVSMF